MLSRLIYISTSAADVTYDTVNEILTYALEKNSKKGVTGVLLWDKQHFLQCLEGERAVIEELFIKINNDTRHTNIRLLGVIDAKEHTYQSWSMGFVNHEKLTKQVIQECCGCNTLQADSLTYDTADCILNLLIKFL